MEEAEDDGCGGIESLARSGEGERRGEFVHIFSEKVLQREHCRREQCWGEWG